MRSHLAILVALSLGAAACSDPVGPTSGAPDPAAALAASASFGGPNYLMRYAGYDVPDDVADLVEELGGTLDQVWADIGVGVVSGVDADGAARLGALLSVAAIQEDPLIQWIPASETMGARFEAPQTATNQSGAFFFDRFQWYLRQIDADDAWDASNQGAGTVVAVLDTGIDPFHQDLAGRVDPGASASVLTPGSSPCGAFDENTVFDLNFHGSFVSGLVTSNGLGMGSVSPDGGLIGVKVLNCTGSGSFGDVIAGIMHATAAGADVINMSLGALVPRDDAEPLIDALQAAVDFATDNGVFVVASSGNDGLDFDNLADALAEIHLMHVPSMLRDVLSVGATAPVGQVDFDALASYTNFGQKGADVMAPGGDLVAGGQIEDLILSVCSSFVCGGSNFYVLSSGTSFASPLAAGTAAVVIGEGNDPDRCVTRGADRVLGRGNDHLYSRGRINTLGAVGCERLAAE